jgi:hypothetical protein
MLDSFILLCANSHTPGTFPIARALFELAGHANWVSKKVSEAVGAGDHEMAWKALSSATMGSRFMRKDDEESVEFPKPVHAMDDIRALAEFFSSTTEGKAHTERCEEMYAYLCEFCHPNIGAFMQHCRFENRGDSAYVSMRLSSDASIPLSEASLSILAILVAAETLLDIYKAQPLLQSKVRAIRDEFMRNRDADRDKPLTQH